MPSHEEICEELKRLITHFRNPILVLYLFECHAETLDLIPYKKLVDGSKIFTKTLQESFIELGRRELGVMLRKNTSKKTSALQDARLTTALFLSRIQEQNFTLDCIAFSDCTLTGEAKKRKNYYKNRKRTPASAQAAQLQNLKTSAAAQEFLAALKKQPQKLPDKENVPPENLPQISLKKLPPSNQGDSVELEPVDESSGYILISQAQIVKLVEARIDIVLQKLQGKKLSESSFELEHEAKLESKNCLRLKSKDEVKQKLSKSVQTLFSLRVMSQLRP